MQTRTVAEWSRQLLLWEHAQDMRVGMRPADAGSAGTEPTALAIGILADRADPPVAAALLDDTRIWQALLIRDWGDGGAALGQIVTQAGLETGTAGDHAVRTGLHVIGAGLGADDPARVDGEPGDRCRRRAGARRSRGDTPLRGRGRAPGRHRRTAVRRTDDVVKGLGYVTLDRGAAEQIEQALDGWALAQPRALEGANSDSPLPAVGVPSAFLAVQHWAQRSDHALDALQARETAEDRNSGGE